MKNNYARLGQGFARTESSQLIITRSKGEDLSVAPCDNQFLFSNFSQLCFSTSFSLLPQALSLLRHDLSANTAINKTRRLSRIFFIIYSLGAIPRCWSSLRTILFSHAASDSSPSCCCARSIISRSSGSSRNWNGGLPRLSFLYVDTLITPDVMCLCVMTHYTQKLKKTTPRSAGTLSRRLTTTLSACYGLLCLTRGKCHPRRFRKLQVQLVGCTCQNLSLTGTASGDIWL